MHVPLRHARSRLSENVQQMLAWLQVLQELESPQSH
jgi:hypothetical protein